MIDSSTAERLQSLIQERFGADLLLPATIVNANALARLLAHRSHRDYTGQPVDEATLELLFACALSAPSKSDLQQADIIHVVDPAKRAVISDLIPEMPWVRAAPVFLIFCANNRRLRLISEMRGKTFANDHLDAFFNATLDAGIVLATFLQAAAAIGLGCCPISVIRDHAETISHLLELPQWVFPVAGLCVGHPADTGQISPRLPLALTVHRDRYDEAQLPQHIDAYDRRRHALRPYRRQREIDRFGRAQHYGWSEDKARQYARPQRVDFGRFVRAKGFRLD